MKLAKLVRDALGLRLSLPDTEVLQVVQDSRDLEGGTVYFCRAARTRARRTPGLSRRRWRRGRWRLSVKRRPKSSGPSRGYYAVPYIYVPDDKAALAQLAATFYGRPSEKLFCFGVTGTDGKTTTSYLLHHLPLTEL